MYTSVGNYRNRLGNCSDTFSRRVNGHIRRVLTPVNLEGQRKGRCASMRSDSVAALRALPSPAATIHEARQGTADRRSSMRYWLPLRCQLPLWKSISSKNLSRQRNMHNIFRSEVVRSQVNAKMRRKIEDITSLPIKPLNIQPYTATVKTY